jgi:uncharacterized membrane protein
MSDLSALRRAKRPRTPLAGPYGHPFHAMLVTVPIGAWTGALVFDVVSFFAEDPEPFVRGAMWLVGIGVLGGLLAAVFGLLDFSILTRGTKARRIALTHMMLNISAIVLFAVSFLVRLNAPADEPAVVGFVLALLGYGAVGASGFLGGELTYRYGVRVADEETQAEAHR